MFCPQNKKHRLPVLNRTRNLLSTSCILFLEPVRDLLKLIPVSIEWQGKPNSQTAGWCLIVVRSFSIDGGISLANRKNVLRPIVVESPRICVAHCVWQFVPMPQEGHLRHSQKAGRYNHYQQVHWLLSTNIFCVAWRLPAPLFYLWHRRSSHK